MSETGLPGGVLTATLTPFRDDRSPDHDLLFEHCVSLIERGSNGIALLGTTGEANSISNGHRKEILEQLVARGFEKHRLVVGTGTCSLNDTIDLTRYSLSQDVHNILLMPPWYYRGVSDGGLIQYFSSLIEEVDNPNLRIYLYHFPRMSGIDMSIELIQTLIDKYGPVIAGMKDSSGDIDHMRAMIEAFPEMRIYAGTEKLLTSVLNAGGVGCISATTNFGIDMAARVYASWQAGAVDKDAEERMINNRIAFEGNNFASALKAVLGREKSGFLNVLPPLTPLNDSDRDLIIKELQIQ